MPATSSARGDARDGTADRRAEDGDDWRGPRRGRAGPALARLRPRRHRAWTQPRPSLTLPASRSPAAPTPRHGNAARRHFLTFDDPGRQHHRPGGRPDQTGEPPGALRARGGITECHIGARHPDVAEMHRFWTRHWAQRARRRTASHTCGRTTGTTASPSTPCTTSSPCSMSDTGLAHINFQVASIDDIMRSWHFLQDNGVEIEMGPGRYPQSTAVFLYFKPGGHHLGVLLASASSRTTWTGSPGTSTRRSPTSSTCGGARPRHRPCSSDRDMSLRHALLGFWQRGR